MKRVVRILMGILIGVLVGLATAGLVTLGLTDAPLMVGGLCGGLAAWRLGRQRHKR